MLSLLRAWVQSLVGELRFHKHMVQPEKKKKDSESERWKTSEQSALVLPVVPVYCLEKMSKPQHRKKRTQVSPEADQNWRDRGGSLRKPGC